MDYGLPKLVIDLFLEKQTHLDTKMKWKIIGSGDYTQLTITWTVDQNSSPVTQHGHGYENVNKPQQSALYRKKSPSELRRQRQRKATYIKRKQEISNDNKHVSTVQNGSMKNTVSDTHRDNANPPSEVVSSKQGPSVKTRSMVKRDSTPECPRVSDDALHDERHPGLSPVSVHSSDQSDHEVSLLTTSMDNTVEGAAAELSHSVYECSVTSCESPSKSEGEDTTLREALSLQFTQFESSMDTKFDAFMARFNDIIK